MPSSSKGTPADIIAEFPGPVILYPSKLHLVHMFLGCVVLFFGGIFLLHSAALAGFERAAIIGCVIMGGLGAPMAAVAFLPKAAFLRLDKAGFEVANCFYSRKYPWSDVTDFGVWVGPYGVRALGLKVRWRSHLIPGLLPDTYGFTVEEIVGLMRSWQNLAIPSLSPELALKNAARHLKDGERPFVADVGKLGGMFAHVTALQWAGFAIIGLSFVVALIVFFMSIHASPSAASLPTDVLSDHGPKRVECDSKWGNLPINDPGEYPVFLQKCMNGDTSRP